MKRLTLCCVLIFTMLATGIRILLYTENTADDLNRKIDEVRSLSKSGDMNAAYEIASELCSEWENFCIYNIFITDRECTLEISDTLIKIKAMAAEESDEIGKECLTAKGLIAYYRRSQRPLPENIF